MSRTRTLALLLLLAGLATAAGAGARELSGVTLPDRAAVAGKSLVLNGMGVREATFLAVKVYVAGLYLESPSGDASRVVQSTQVKRLVLHFVRDVNRDQVVDAWNDGFEKNAGKSVGALKSRIQKLNGWMTRFRDGDTLTFTYVPGVGVSVAIGAATKGTVEGDDFARALFSIWLGPEPPNASLKAGLLGKR